MNRLIVFDSSFLTLYCIAYYTHLANTLKVIIHLNLMLIYAKNCKYNESP